MCQAPVQRAIPKSRAQGSTLGTPLPVAKHHDACIIRHRDRIAIVQNEIVGRQPFRASLCIKVIEGGGGLEFSSARLSRLTARHRRAFQRRGFQDRHPVGRCSTVAKLGRVHIAWLLPWHCWGRNSSSGLHNVSSLSRDRRSAAISLTSSRSVSPCPPSSRPNGILSSERRIHSRTLPASYSENPNFSPNKTGIVKLSNHS